MRLRREADRLNAGGERTREAILCAAAWLATGHGRDGLIIGNLAAAQRLAFELNGIMPATDTNFVQHEDLAVLDLARQIVRQRLGVGGP